MAVAVAVLGLGASPAPAELTPVDEIRQAAQDVLSGSGYQRELPGSEGGAASRRRGSRQGKPAAPESRRDRDWSLEVPEDGPSLPSGLGGMAELILWILVLVGGGLLAYHLVNELPRWLHQRRAGRGRGPSRDPEAAPLVASPAVAATSLEQADRLARRGAYGEAIHLLLLHSLTELDRRLEAAFAPSLTSREILGRLSLREDAKAALARIVTSAELDHFGGRASSESDYLSCREAYRRLAAVGDGAA